MAGPLATRLAADLRRRFACAGLSPGDRLPSLRAIEAETGASRSVAMEALALLAREGVLRRSHGRGTFLVSVPPLAAAGVRRVLVLAVGLAAGHPYLARLLDGLAAAAAGLGCTLDVLPIGLRGGGLRTALAQRAPAGILVAGEPAPAVLAAVRASGIPCAVAGGDPAYAGAGTSWAGHDDREGAYQATQHLLALGRRRIAWVGGEHACPYHRLRHAGWREALADAGLVAEPGLAVHARRGRIGAAVARLARSRRPPDALLVAGDELAPAAYAALARAGLRPGRDCAVVGFDDLAVAATLDPPLTTMRAEVERLGGEALRLLLRRIAGLPAERVLLPRRLVRRESSRRAEKAPGPGIRQT